MALRNKSVEKISEKDHVATHNIWHIWEMKLEQEVILFTMARKEWETYLGGVSEGFHANK